MDGFEQEIENAAIEYALDNSEKRHIEYVREVDLDHVGVFVNCEILICKENYYDIRFFKKACEDVLKAARLTNNRGDEAEPEFSLDAFVRGWIKGCQEKEGVSANA